MIKHAVEGGTETFHAYRPFRAGALHGSCQHAEQESRFVPSPNAKHGKEGKVDCCDVGRATQLVERYTAADEDERAAHQRPAMRARRQSVEP